MSLPRVTAHCMPTIEGFLDPRDAKNLSMTCRHLKTDSVAKNVLQRICRGMGAHVYNALLKNAMVADGDSEQQIIQKLFAKHFDREESKLPMSIEGADQFVAKIQERFTSEYDKEDYGDYKDFELLFHLCLISDSNLFDHLVALIQAKKYPPSEMKLLIMTLATSEKVATRYPYFSGVEKECPVATLIEIYKSDRYFEYAEEMCLIFAVLARNHVEFSNEDLEEIFAFVEKYQESAVGLIMANVVEEGELDEILRAIKWDCTIKLTVGGLGAGLLIGVGMALNYVWTSYMGEYTCTIEGTHVFCSNLFHSFNGTLEGM